MKLSTAFFLGATALAGAASFSGTAQAIPFNAGSLAINAGTSTTSQLGTTTSFTIVPPSVNLGTGTGDFATLGATFAKTTFDLTNGSTFSFSDPTGLGTFTANAGAVTILENLGGTTAVLAFFVAGTFTVGADFDNAGTTITADETFALTQTNGAGQAISISGTFQAPEVPPLPEPMTIAMFGAGLLGLGVMRRAKKA